MKNCVQAAKKLQRLEEEEEAITEHAKEERERAARVRHEEEAREAAAKEAKREDVAAVHAVRHAHGAGEKSKEVQQETHEAHRGRHVAVRRKRRARVGVAGRMAAARKAAHKAAVHKGAVRSKGSGEVKKGGGAWAERLRYALSKGVPLVAPRHVAPRHVRHVASSLAANDGVDGGKEHAKVAKANILQKKKVLYIVALFSICTRALTDC